MAMKVKAVEKLLKFDKNSAGVYRYVMSPEMYSSLNQKKVIKAWATEGHSVALPGLGTMRFGLRSKSVEDVNKVKTGLITSRRIIFTPDVDLKDELKNTAIVITCYDRDGKEVKRVTSADDAEVEDNENPGNTGDGTTGGGTTDSGNNGSTGSGSTDNGGNTGTVTPGGGDEG